MSKLKLNKLTKAQVQAKIRKHRVFSGFLCPSKCRPNLGHPFNMAIPFTVNTEKELEKIINEFAYYNCNKETGNGVHYYEECQK